MMKSFIKRQKQHLHELGLLKWISTRMVKLGRLLPVLMVVVIMFPLYLVIILIRPLKLIRFGYLAVDRIGHFAGNNELYLCEKDHGLQPADSLDIFYYSGPVCNHQLLTMWKRILCVNKITNLFRWISLFPGGNIHKIETTYFDRDVHGLLEKSSIHISFTNDEIKLAKHELRKMGIEDGRAYICIANRDAAYLTRQFVNQDWGYHNYRNSSIQNYVLASKELAERGYYVIRTGSVIDEIMETNNQKIIEYAAGGFRSELLDIYLPANCYFSINGESGLGGIARIFRRPLIMVNIAPLEYILGWGSNIISIPKKFWLKRNKKFMSFREIIESGAGRYLHTHKFIEHGIELIENTPEEIRDVAIEMDERLKGTWESTEEDEELQKRFWSLYKPNDLNRVFRSRIGAEFLRQNSALLD